MTVRRLIAFVTCLLAAGNAAFPAPASKGRHIGGSQLQRRFTEAQRRQLFYELASLEDKAHRQAARECPVPDPSRTGYDQQLAGKQVMAQADRVNVLEERFTNAFARKHRLTRADLRTLRLEGVTKTWPLAPLKSANR
jgi:hypothetical protein